MSRGQKSRRGGARPGAGRPATRDEPSVVVSARLEAAEVAALDGLAAGAAETRGATAARLLRAGIAAAARRKRA